MLLENLPVRVIVRLCTDEKSVVSFYNELDNELELELEVLNNFMQEALEVHIFASTPSFSRDGMSKSLI